MKLKVDKFTIAQAIDYADREGMIQGFKKGSAEWNHAYNHHIKKALGTMTLGRNPFRGNPRDDANWPEVFGENGFAGEVARKYKGKGGEKFSRREIIERVKGNVTALSYLYVNGIMDIKTTTLRSQSGNIPESEMSDLQLRDQAYEKENEAVVRNQLILTIVETLCYESLIPFFTMPEKDVRAIADTVKITGKASVREMAEQRSVIEKKLRNRIAAKLRKVSFADLFLKD
jgi:hypothetical protein